MDPTGKSGRSETGKSGKVDLKGLSELFARLGDRRGFEKVAGEGEEGSKVISSGSGKSGLSSTPK